MSDNIIHLADHRRPPPQLRDWTFNLAVYSVPGGSEAIVADTPPDGRPKAEQLRSMAAQLGEIRFLMLQQANLLKPDADGRVVATATIWESSLVQLRSNADMTTEAAAGWLRDRLKDAKGAVTIETGVQPGANREIDQ